MSSIDIYLFKIEDYPKSREGSISFGDIMKSNNIINDISNNDISNNAIYCVDYIKFKTNIKNKYYKLYKTRKAKDTTGYNFTKEYLSDFEKHLNATHNILESQYNKENKNEIKDFDLMECGYIRKIILQPEDEVIIFGDHHGSYHTFFRNLLRLHLMGCIDINTFKINNNYKIIFLGDIVDRGQYSLEILDILYQFIINNDGKIYINRGNHEEMTQNLNDGLYSEISKKVPNDKVDSIYGKINTVFSYCSTAIILIMNQRKQWLCHGCIPVCIDFIKTLTEFIDGNNNILKLERYIAYQIRWNDTCKVINNINDSNHKKRLTSNNTKSIRTQQCNIIFCVGLDIIYKYMDIFDFIIRGHEDSCGNAWLLHNNEERVYRLNCKYLGEPSKQFDLHYNDNFIDSSNNIITVIKDKYKKIDRPVQTIQSGKSDVLNVLTISTNTDHGRHLTADSFIILRFGKSKVLKVKENNNNIDNWLNKFEHYCIDEKNI